MFYWYKRFKFYRLGGCDQLRTHLLKIKEFEENLHNLTISTCIEYFANGHADESVLTNINYKLTLEEEKLDSFLQNNKDFLLRELENNNGDDIINNHRNDLLKKLRIL